jgi:hypothetical protein
MGVYDDINNMPHEMDPELTTREMSETELMMLYSGQIQLRRILNQTHRLLFDLGRFGRVSFV